MIQVLENRNRLRITIETIILWGYQRPIEKEIRNIERILKKYKLRKCNYVIKSAVNSNPKSSLRSTPTYSKDIIVCK